MCTALAGLGPPAMLMLVLTRISATSATFTLQFIELVKLVTHTKQVQLVLRRSGTQGLRRATTIEV